MLQLIDRSFGNTSYLIDIINNEVNLVTNYDINKNRGYIKTIKIDKKLKIDDLRKIHHIRFWNN